MHVYSSVTLVLVAIFVAGVTLVCLRIAVRRLWYVAAMLAALLAVVSATLNVSRVGFHGQMHWAFSLATRRGLAPEDPVFAGEPLMYPWLAHFAYATVAKWFGVSPVTILLASDSLLLATMLSCAAIASAVVFGKPKAGVVGILLCWTGVLVTDNSYIRFVSNFCSAVRPCMRMVPADKFFNPNNNPIGLALVSASVLCVVSILRRDRIGWRWVALLGLCSLGCAVLYPLSFLALTIGVGGGGAFACVMHRRWSDRRLWACGICVAGAGVTALPIMMMFDSGRGPEAAIVFSSLTSIGGKMAQLAAVGWFAVALVLSAWNCRRDGSVGDPAAVVRCVLLGWAMSLAAAYLVISVPLECEYKFLAHTAVPLACLLSEPILRWAKQRPFTTWAILAILCLGAADRVLVRFALDWTPKVAMQGGVAHAIDAERDAMLTYLREHTPRDSVVIAEDPLVPIVGERSLFLLPSAVGTSGGDGWSMSRWKVALLVVGHSRNDLSARERLQTGILSPKSAEEAASARAALRTLFPRRPVYVMTEANDRESERDLLGWEKVYEGRGGAICVLRESD